MSTLRHDICNLFYTQIQAASIGDYRSTTYTVNDGCMDSEFLMDNSMNSMRFCVKNSKLMQ